MKISKILLILGSLVYFGFGLLFFIHPDAITDIDGIILPDRSAANHIRAVLGGMEIGLGILLLYFVLDKKRIQYGLIVLAGSIGITSLARLYGIVFDGASNTSNWLSFLAEFSFGLLAFILFFIERKREKSGTENNAQI
ncbi:DUF4345 domain-containing protein [Cecembia sp.]|uniref:DUF4345 domain-containing protein n=1 Tax=Cecembia sp. TaxID=1898110 RepID=UPI0025C22A3F|nr:DUF4345 domain-containing protein [Cecembia sp.]